MTGTLRVGFVVGLWTIALCMMAVRTALRENSSLAPLTGWSSLLALLACAILGWHLLILERHRVETIAELAARGAVERQRLTTVN